MREWITRLAPVLLALVTTTAAGRAQTYGIDAPHNRVTIAVGRAGLLKLAGHDHEVIASSMTGEVTVDTAQIGLSSVNLSFDSAALHVTGRGEPPEDVPKVQANMTGPKVLDAARFPTITFRSVSVTGEVSPAGVWNIEASGDLDLHGVTRRIRLPLQMQMGGDSLTATGAVVLRQSDFGMKPLSVAYVVKVKDEVAVAFRIVARVR